jgi:hypothetical protein
LDHLNICTFSEGTVQPHTSTNLRTLLSNTEHVCVSKYHIRFYAHKVWRRIENLLDSCFFKYILQTNVSNTSCFCVMYFRLLLHALVRKTRSIF